MVQAALDRARLGRTTLIVAHRLSTIRSADLVVAIGDGQVAEMGTHKELLAQKGLYHSLVTAQIQSRGDDIDEDEDDDTVAEKQKQLEKTLEETRRKSFTALDDEEVMPITDTISEALMDVSCRKREGFQRINYKMVSFFISGRRVSQTSSDNKTVKNELS